MKLRSLEVSDFRRIRRAKLELGAGLNVVYGPNDLGKSTLVEALRAALLLPSTSATANDFVPWDRDATPGVSLELEHDGVLFCVKKTWGSGTRATALLERADDGLTFTVDARQREVDGKLRELFAWGVASPGGKQAPRGLPQSFLTSVLFGTQAESDALFGASLDADSDESGRLRLTDALEAYAQDPVLKEILERAQKRVDEAFSATGLKRKGKSSPFREPGESVKEAKRQLDVAVERLERAQLAREEAERLREALANATARRDLARETLEQAARDAEATERRRAAVQALEEARSAREAFVANERRVRELRETLAEREARSKEQVVALELAAAREKAARAALDDARATLRDVRGQDHERELRVQELTSARKDLVARLDALDAGARRAQAAVEARAKAEASARAAEEAAAQVRKHARDVDEAQASSARLDAAATLLARRELDRRVEQLAEATRELDALAKRVKAREEELATPLAPGPTRTILDALRACASERAVAEAKLAVGLSLALRRLGDATIEAHADGASVPVDGKTLALEAHRELRVKVTKDGEPLVELVVSGGAAEARAQAEAAVARWRERATEAGVDPELPPDEALARLAADVDATEERRRAREEAERARQSEREQLGRLSAQREEHDALVDRVASRAPLTLTPELHALAEALLVDLGDEAEHALDARRSEAHEREASARAALEEARRVHAERSSRAEVDAREAELKDEAVGAPDGEERELLVARVEALDAQLATLREAASAASRAADEAVANARSQLDAAELAVTSARAAMGESERALAGDHARLEELERTLARTDGARLAADVTLREAELEAAPAPSREVDLDALAAARAALDDAERATTEARERHLRFLGQVEASEGTVAIERHRDAKEAYELALVAEREIEVDYGAWRLLRDALREAENSEGHHLGEALAPKVAVRLTELAKQTGAPARYTGLSLDAHLRTEGVVSQGTARDPKQLSVGTREQVALLLRLAVAEILKLPLILDDHLTHTDPARARWFRETLRAAAHDTQIVVLTCHPDVYLDAADRPPERAYLDRAAGLLRAIDATRIVEG